MDYTFSTYMSIYARSRSARGGGGCVRTCSNARGLRYCGVVQKPSSLQNNPFHGQAYWAYWNNLPLVKFTEKTCKSNISFSCYVKSQNNRKCPALVISISLQGETRMSACSSSPIWIWALCQHKQHSLEAFLTQRALRTVGVGEREMGGWCSHTFTNPHRHIETQTRIHTHTHTHTHTSHTLKQCIHTHTPSLTHIVI